MVHAKLPGRVSAEDGGMQQNKVRGALQKSQSLAVTLMKKVKRKIAVL